MVLPLCLSKILTVVMRVLLFQTHCCKINCQPAWHLLLQSVILLIIYFCIYKINGLSRLPMMLATVSYIDFVGSDYHLSTSLHTTLNILILYPLVSSNTICTLIKCLHLWVSYLTWSLLYAWAFFVNNASLSTVEIQCSLCQMRNYVVTVLEKYNYTCWNIINSNWTAF